MKLFTFIIVLLAAQTTLFAQDWYKASPANKKVLVDNDHIRMIEVTIAPGVEEPMHTHPQYIEYYTQGAKLLVTFEGKKGVEWLTESGKAYPGDGEGPHTLKNIDTKPAKLLLIEMKDKPYVPKK